jgi:hypothetical protein
MYSLSPGLTAMLANERIADLGRERAAFRLPRPSFDRLRWLRNATGWALVEVGLRLVISRRSPDNRGVVSRQRTLVRAAR